MMFSYIDNEPVVPLNMRNGRGLWKRFFGYVDSGATFSVFNRDVAKLLGLPIDEGHKQLLIVGNGEKIEAYIQTVSIHFANKEFNASIAFSSQLGVGTNIIGLTSFFDNFHICFNHKKKFLEITPYG